MVEKTYLILVSGRQLIFNDSTALFPVYFLVIFYYYVTIGIMYEVSHIFYFHKIVNNKVYLKCFSYLLKTVIF